MSVLVLTSYTGSWFFHLRAGRGLSLSPSRRLLLRPQRERLLSAIFSVSCAILVQTRIPEASRTILSLVLRREHRASFQAVCLEIEEAESHRSKAERDLRRKKTNSVMKHLEWGLLVMSPM